MPSVLERAKAIAAAEKQAAGLSPMERAKAIVESEKQSAVSPMARARQIVTQEKGSPVPVAAAEPPDIGPIDPENQELAEALKSADWDAVRAGMPIKRPEHMQEPRASMHDPGQGRGSPDVAERAVEMGTGLAKTMGPPVAGAALGSPLGPLGMAGGAAAGQLLSSLWQQAESGQQMLRGQGIPQPTLGQGMIEMAEEHPIMSPLSAGLESAGTGAATGVGAKVAKMGLSPMRETARNALVDVLDATVNAPIQTYLNDPDPSSQDVAMNTLKRGGANVGMSTLGAFLGGKPQAGDTPPPRNAPVIPRPEPPAPSPVKPIGFDEVPPTKKGVMPDEVPQKGQEVLTPPRAEEPGPSQQPPAAPAPIKGEWEGAVDVPKVETPPAETRAKIRAATGENVPPEVHGFGLGKAGRTVERGIVGAATDTAKPFYRPRRVLEQTAEGSDVVQLVDKVETRRRMRHGKTVAEIEKATEKLNFSDKRWMRENFKREMEAGNPMPNARIQAWADQFRGVTNQYGELAERLGVQIFDPRAKGGKRPFKRSIQNYFPRQWTEEALTALREGHGDLFDAIQREVGDVEIDPIGIVGVSGTRRRYGSTELPRTIMDPPARITVNGQEVKIIEDDPFRAIDSYMDRASRNLTVIEHFGQMGEKINPDEISRFLTKTAGSDSARQWENIWKDLNGEYQHDAVRNLGRMGDAITAAEQIARTGQLSLSTLSNVGGYMPIAVRYGAKNAAKSFARSLTAHAGELVGIKTKAAVDIDAARSHDAWRNDVLQNNYQVEDFKGLTGKAGRTAMKATAFNTINRHIQKVGSLASREALEQWVALVGGGRTGALRKLWGVDAGGARTSLKREFGFSDTAIDRMVKSGVKEEDYAQAVQRAAADINVYAESPLSRPRWMSDPIARRLMSYMSYSRAQGNQLADSVTAFKQGNVRPLLTTIIGYAPVGIALNELRDWMYDREKKDESFLAKVGAGYMQMATLGLVGALAQDIYYGARRGTALSLTPAPIEFWGDMTMGMFKALQKLPDRGAAGLQAYKTTVKKVPAFRALDARAKGPVWQDEHKKDSIRPLPVPQMPKRPPLPNMRPLKRN